MPFGDFLAIFKTSEQRATDALNEARQPDPVSQGPCPNPECEGGQQMQYPSVEGEASVKTDEEASMHGGGNASVAGAGADAGAGMKSDSSISVTYGPGRTVCDTCEEELETAREMRQEAMNDIDNGVDVSETNNESEVGPTGNDTEAEIEGETDVDSEMEL